METLKRILSISFLIFMFLPLSQCGGTECVEGANDCEPTPPDQLVLIEDFENGIAQGMGVLIVFALPLVSCFIKPKSFNSSVASNIFQLVVASWFSFLVWNWVYSGFRT